MIFYSSFQTHSPLLSGPGGWPVWTVSTRLLSHLTLNLPEGQTPEGQCTRIEELLYWFSWFLPFQAMLEMGRGWWLQFSTICLVAYCAFIILLKTKSTNWKFQLSEYKIQLSSTESENRNKNTQHCKPFFSYLHKKKALKTFFIG